MKDKKPEQLSECCGEETNGYIASHEGTGSKFFLMCTKCGKSTPPTPAATATVEEWFCIKCGVSVVKIQDSVCKNCFTSAPTTVSSDWEQLLARHWVFDPTADREVYIGDSKHPTLQDLIRTLLTTERQKARKEAVEAITKIIENMTVADSPYERNSSMPSHGGTTLTNAFRKGRAECQKELIEKLSLLSKPE